MTDYPTIRAWSASRSGAAITVKGTAKDGSPIKIGGVRLIQPTTVSPNAVRALTKDGETYILLTT